MQEISLDSENELSDIAAEVDHLRRSLARVQGSLPARGTHEGWEAVHICASATEKIYTGVERVMSMIATGVDGGAVGRSDGWHVALLKRMSHAVLGVRPAVLSPDCYARLDRLRAFRHRERNTYGLDLDFDVVIARSAEAIEAFTLFRREVGSFLDAIDPADPRA
ncbi:ribonuclease toxin HepT-like protein [Methylobacterium iners]|uniref:HepT-like domain-containing protein n=1 Tax=Methylobacterium iners TaxID=418707 RepID=A0ABQ4S059_9HYPH|nr:hypothetical protein [Methylobacterium iners]GJD95324.1 hypothetical protein OCOJLMKI_2536 [Methylobacterium iners]